MKEADEDRFSRYTREWMFNPNPVTRASFRGLAIRLYFELYCVR